MIYLCYSIFLLLGFRSGCSRLPNLMQSIDWNFSWFRHYINDTVLSFKLLDFSFQSSYFWIFEYYFLQFLCKLLSKSIIVDTSLYFFIIQSKFLLDASNFILQFDWDFYGFIRVILKLYGFCLCSLNYIWWKTHL